MTESVFKKIGQVIDGFTKLKVTTKVTNGQNREITTEVNVVTGDAIYTIHEAFLSDPDKLAELHERQVAESREIVASTVRALAELGEKVGEKVESYLQSQ